MIWENVCFDADTLVACDTGYKRIADIAVGTKVKTKSGRYMPVYRVFRTQLREVLKLTVSGQEGIFVTPNHPFYAKKKGADGSMSEPGWVNASELTEGCMVAYRVDLQSLPEDFISGKEVYEMGRQLADGVFKEVPPFVFDLETGMQSVFLTGYLDAGCYVGSYDVPDGHMDIYKAVGREMAYGIARLVRNVHRIPADISKRQDRENDYFVSAVYAADETGNCYDGEFIWQPVKSIEKTDGKRTVYNLGVYEDNTYGANDVVVHNCGAFSSNKGKDFQAVLTEIVRIIEPDADDVPMPEKGRWPKSGILYDKMGRWSVAWRVHDAQFWGVPQRRKRVALVADFGGLSGPEVLLERKGMCRYFEESGETGEGTPASPEAGTGGAISFLERAGKPGGGKGILIQDEKVGTLSTFNNQSVMAGCLNPWDVQSKRIQPEEGVADALWAGEKRFGGGESYVMQEMEGQGKTGECLTPWDIQQKRINPTNGIADTLSSADKMWGSPTTLVFDDREEAPAQPMVFDASRRHSYQPFGDVCETVQAAYGTGGNNQPIVVTEKPVILNDEGRVDSGAKAYSFDSLSSNSMKSKNPYSGCREVEVAKTIDCFDPNPSKNQGGIAIVQAANGTGGNNQPTVVQPEQTAYSIGSNNSEGMKSSNPHAGISETDVSRTLDISGGNPACYQGGIAIVKEAYGFEPGAARRLDPESRFSKEVSPTLRANAGDNQPAVVCAGFDPNQGAKAATIGYEVEKAGTLEAGKVKGVLCLNDQGGAVMDMTTDMTGTLRAQDHGHAPCVMDKPVYTMNPRPQSMCVSEDMAATLGAADYKEPQMVYDGRAKAVTENQQSSVNLSDVTNALCSQGGKPGQGYQCALVPEVYDARGNGDGKVSPTLTGDHQNRVTDYTAITCQEVTDPLMASGYQKNGTQEALNGMYVMQGFGDYSESEKASSCKARDYKDATDLVVGKPEKDVAAVDFMNGKEDPNVNGTLLADESGQSLNSNKCVRTMHMVRRLTPLECERLQGYPDGWTDIGEWVDTKGKVHKESTDSARYKALGNSIALPFWFFLLRRIAAQYEKPATLGSLFDGIGGFPLCWERCNGPGTALWASEIEEFPIAVTKRHFPEKPD